MKRVRVVQGTQVNLSGTLFGGGDIVEAPDDVAETWIVSGWVEPAAPPRKAAPARKGPPNR